MAKTLILHIGDPKTGSSSIQQVLFGRKFDCPTRSLDYPPRLSSANLAKSLWRKGKSGQISAEFTAISEWALASTAEVLAVSAEQFAAVDPQVALNAFQEYLPELAPTMRVVAYVRPHVSRFLSAHTQRTKVGGLFTNLESFFDEMSRNKALIFSGRFHKWRDVFGDRFTLRPMVREELFQGDVVADFLNLALEGAPFALLAATEANSSLPLEALSGLRLVHQVLNRRGMTGDTMHRVGSRINSLVNAAAPGKGTKVKVSTAIYDQILVKCRADADQLDKDFFGRPVMLPALERAASDTSEGKVDAEARQFFEKDLLKTLRQNAAALAEMFATQPRVWTAKFRRDIGQRPPLAPGKDLPAAKADHIRDVEKLLADTAALITPK